MSSFPIGITVNNYGIGDDHINIAVRVEPRFVTLACMQKALTDAETQAQALAERLGKFLTKKGNPCNKAKAAHVEPSTHFMFVFVSLPLREGTDPVVVLELLERNTRYAEMLENHRDALFEGK